MFAHYGVIHFFSDIYRTLGTLYLHGCRPLPIDPSCIKKMLLLPELLAQWPEPIDILIMVFGYGPYIEPDQDKQLETDPGFIFMQQFYTRVAKHVRELFIIEKEHVLFDDSPTHAILRFSNSLPQEPLNAQLEKTYLLHRRYEAITCDRCVKFDLLDVWCHRLNDTTSFFEPQRICRSFDPQNGLTWHIDENHISSYGSLKHGQLLRSLYDRATNKSL
ncbi:hypothetical protein M3Y96_00570600 [Aphelenchoides besseyi]|nr:hypothetical protein M3Y96_00570600 [Aphelenchoides besseyi]